MADKYEELKKIHARAMDSHVHIDSEEFKALSAMVMINDQTDVDYDIEKIHSVLDQIAIKCLGFSGWIEAYHNID